MAGGIRFFHHFFGSINPNPALEGVPPFRDRFFVCFDKGLMKELAGFGTAQIRETATGPLKLDLQQVVVVMVVVVMVVVVVVVV